MSTHEDERINCSYWERIHHYFLTLLGIHIWGPEKDVSEEFVTEFQRRTGLKRSAYRRECQNCDKILTVVR